MRTVPVVLALVIPGVVQAKPWKGIVPEKSTRAEVVKKYGDPSKTLKRGENEMLSYSGDEALPGSRETEFVVNPAGTVEQIAVFPAGPVERATVEEMYGTDCVLAPAGKPCFIRKLNEDDLRTYFWYQRLGLVVFFEQDGHLVQSFLYVKPEAQEAVQVSPWTGKSPAGVAPTAPAAPAAAKPKPKAKPKSKGNDGSTDSDGDGIDP
jgi:hypothetical protein